MERAARQLRRRDGHVVQRLVSPDRGDIFPLTYVRTGPRSEVPVLVLPGGPGLASVAPYGRFRTEAARRGTDVLMIEHRGVCLSRRDAGGRDLPLHAVTIEQTVDDLAAVLDHVGARRAVVYGSSYGTYLAQGFGVRHPNRVAAMVLDSPMLSLEGDLTVLRAHRRRLRWTGKDPALAHVAEAVRAVAAAGVPMDELSSVVQVVYEFAGPEVLHRLLLARRRGRLRRTWQRIAGLVPGEMDSAGVPFVMEPGCWHHLRSARLRVTNRRAATGPPAGVRCHGR